MNFNQFSTERQGNYASLVYKMESQDLYDSLEKGMLENNRVEGLLPISFAQMDDDRYIRYNISNLITLEEYIKGTVTKKTFLNIILSILNTLEATEEYLIAPSHLLMSEQYIFVDTANSKAMMVCLPTEGENNWNLSEFFRQMILRANYSNAEGNDYVLYLLRHFNGENDSFNAKVFKEIVKALVKNTKEINGGLAAVSQGSITPTPQPAVQMQTAQTVAEEKSAKASEETGKSGSRGLFVRQNNRQSDAPRSVPTPAVSVENQKPQSGVAIPPVPGQKPQSGVAIPPVPGQKAQGGASIPPIPGQKPQPAAAPTQSETGKKGFFDKLIGKKDKATDEVPTPMPNSVPQPQAYATPANSEKTVVLGIEDPQATVMLTADMQQSAYLVRKSTGERIQIIGSDFAIGRDASQANYVVGNNPAVGRCHARIVCSGGTYYFIDNNSKNFSYINGARVAAMQQVELRSGTAVRLANEEFEFVM